MRGEVFSKGALLLCFIFKVYFSGVVEGNSWVFDYSWNKTNGHQPIRTVTEWTHGGTIYYYQMDPLSPRVPLY